MRLISGSSSVPVGHREHPQGVLQEHHGGQGPGPQLEEADLQSNRSAGRLCPGVLQVPGLP